MAAKVSKVVSFSSEDPRNPASGILKDKKWLCKEEGEKQAWLLLQLESPVNISDIDIGNEGSAFIEVQVGRQGWDINSYKVILVASSFMSPGESRNMESTSRVRMFSKEKLNQDAVKDKWDMLKIVCSQPFNRHTKYGLRFVTVKGQSDRKPDDEAAKKAAAAPAGGGGMLGAFKLKAAEEPNVAVGSYFARFRQKGESSPAVQMRKEPPPAAAANKNLFEELSAGGKKRKGDAEAAAGPSKRARPAERLPRRDALPGESPPPERKRKESGDKKDTARGGREAKPKETRGKRDESRNNKAGGKEAAAVKPPKTAPFKSLFSGVVFTLSGFQNPLRGEIRAKGLEMGAKYKGDWDRECSHLVCAFTNTPKFNQVKGKGKIVKKDWIERSHAQRRRLPWRRFCLDKADKGASSEEEVEEEENGKEKFAGRAAAAQPDMDTDEEIERAMRHHVDKDEDMDTDEEIERQLNKRKEKKKKEKSSPKEEREKKPDKKSPGKKASNKERNVSNNVRPGPSSAASAYDEDTDEDEPVGNGAAAAAAGKQEVSSDEAYDVDTDVDEAEAEKLRPNTERLKLPTFDEYFAGKRLMVYSQMEADERHLLERYIVPFGGVVESYMSASVDIVLAKEWDDKFREAAKTNSDVVFVRPEWVFKCADKRRLVSVDQFLITG